MHGHRVYTGMSEQTRDHWIRHGTPLPVIDRMAAFEDRWGGLLLPPAPRYEGGPKYFQTDVPEPTADGGWWFDAGDQRCSVPYGFVIGPNDEFGISGDRPAFLHASVEGWIESVALAYTARLWAPRIVTVWGAAVDDIDLTGMTRITEVAGLTDSWWWGGNTAVAIYRGEAVAFDSPAAQVATSYTGIADPVVYLDL